MAVFNRPFGQLLTDADAKRVPLCPHVRMQWSGANDGIDCPDRRVPTSNEWAVGWCPSAQSYGAYRYSRRDGHRAWLFSSFEDAESFCSFLKAKDWAYV